MKNIILIFGIILLSQNVFAQRPHLRGDMIENFKEIIELTSEQEAKIEDIQEKYQTKKKAIFENESLDRMEKRKQMGSLMKAMQEETGAVLTEEQKATLKEDINQMRQERMEMRKARMEKAKKARKQTRTAVEQYKEENVLPTLLEQRAKLEEVLSDEDKATIAELRSIFLEMKSKKEQRRAKMKKAGERPNRAEIQTERKAFFEANKPHFEKLKSLIEKYDEAIGGLMEEIEEERATWQEDIKKIHGQNHPERGDRFEKGRRDGQRFHGKRHGERGDRHRKHKMRGDRKPHSKKGHFLLLDPNTAEEIAIVENASTTMTVFPNPASNATTISYDVTSKGNVRIELRDEAGNVLKVLEDGQKTIGKYKIEVDLSDLQSGVYYYSITNGQGLQSKKIIVSK